MQATYGLRRTALLRRNETAVLEGDLRWTWQEVAGRVERVAGALQGLGVESGDPVAVLMLNGHRFLELYYAVPWAGAVIVPLNTRLAAPELIFQMNDCGAKVLVLDDTFVPMLEQFEGKLETVEHLIYAGDQEAPPSAADYELVLEDSSPVPDSERDGYDTYGIFYTGGTTGRAKGVMLSHDNIVSNALNGLICLQYEPSDVYLHVAPMFHLADAGAIAGLTICGGTHATIPSFDAEKTLVAIQKHKVTRVVLVPTMINMVVNHPSVGEYDVSSLKTVLYGASPIPVALLQKAMEALPCGFIQGYGMTELSPLATVLPYEDHLHDPSTERAKRLKSAGVPVPTAEVRVVDVNDNGLPPGDIGEICVRGPIVMKGYLNLPEATAEAVRDGWMHTGDVGYMDQDGYVYLVDRAKDMIVSGGENIYSVEVEAALYEHPAVLEAAVIGIPNEEWGEAVHAVVVPKPGQTVTQEELIEHCRALIARYKVPKSFTFKDDPLPKSGAAKILKRELRRPFWGDEQRQIH